MVGYQNPLVVFRGGYMKTKIHDGWYWIITAVFFAAILFIINTAQAYDGEVVVTFNRELPNGTYNFTRVYEDKDAFEMWLQDRLETKGCDPYLTDMKIQFKPRNPLDFPAPGQ